MAEAKRLERDLAYVRGVVSKRGGGPVSPPGIFYLWAALILVGFSLVDFAVEWVGLYWLVAAPVGAAASFYLGWRHGYRRGEVHPAVGDKYLLHWSGLLGAVLLSLLAVRAGAVSWDGFGATILLLSGLAYFLVGVHGDRPFLWLGLLLAAGYAGVLLLPGPIWTVVGVLLAVTMVASGLGVAQRRRGRGAAG